MVSAAALVELIGPWADGADPLNEQLAAALARAIELGLLPPGTRLPAERELARVLALSRTTIVAAYDRLRLAGLARSRQGSGTRVAARRPGLSRPHSTSVEVDRHGRRPSCGAATAAGPASAVGLLTPLVDDAIELTIGALPAGPAVADSIATALRDDLPALLREMGYDPFGLPALRGQIAAYLDPPRRADRARPGPHHEWRAAGAPPDRVAARRTRERPSSWRTRPTSGPSTRSGRPAIGSSRSPWTTDGPRVEVMAGLLASSAPVRLAYVVPTFQNPTGAVMPEIAPPRAGRACRPNTVSRSSRTSPPT